MPLITSEINYDENVNTISKTYSNGLSFSVAYDDKGNIISNERNSYEYDKYGELIQTTGAVNSSYTYDGRGNLLTKTVNGETTEFEYNNECIPKHGVHSAPTYAMGFSSGEMIRVASVAS